MILWILSALAAIVAFAAGWCFGQAQKHIVLREMLLRAATRGRCGLCWQAIRSCPMCGKPMMKSPTSDGDAVSDYWECPGCNLTDQMPKGKTQCTS